MPPRKLLALLLQNVTGKKKKFIQVNLEFSIQYLWITLFRQGFLRFKKIIPLCRITCCDSQQENLTVKNKDAFFHSSGHLPKQFQLHVLPEKQQVANLLADTQFN